MFVLNPSQPFWFSYGINFCQAQHLLRKSYGIGGSDCSDDCLRPSLMMILPIINCIYFYKEIASLREYYSLLRCMQFLITVLRHFYEGFQQSINIQWPGTPRSLNVMHKSQYALTTIYLHYISPSGAEMATRGRAYNFTLDRPPLPEYSYSSSTTPVRNAITGARSQI
jgi:hypothetical protein